MQYSFNRQNGADLEENSTFSEIREKILNAKLKLINYEKKIHTYSQYFIATKDRKKYILRSFILKVR